MSFFEVKLKVPKWSKGIFTILSTTISSLILLFPVQIYYFGAFEVRLLVSSIVTYFFACGTYCLGFFSLFALGIPFLSDILLQATYCFLHLLVWILNFLSKIPIETLYLPRPSLFELYLYYFSLLCLVGKKYLVFIRKKVLKIRIRRSVKIGVFLSFSFLFIGMIYRMYFEEYVIYFNVGQGNMALIRKDRKIVMVDMGSTTDNLSASILNQFLRAKAIDQIDLVLLTHMHTDHINGIYGVNATIQKIGYAIPKEQTKEYQEFLQYIHEKEIATITLQKGDILTFSNLIIEVLLPSNDQVIKSSDIANSNSMVLLIQWGKQRKSLLFMGDATIETEQVLLKNLKNKEKLKKIDVLQIGHHGSKTSTSEEFLNEISCQIAILSAKKKVYGHPSLETITKLEKYAIRYYVTEECGAVYVKIRKKEIRIKKVW